MYLTLKGACFKSSSLLKHKNRNVKTDSVSRLQGVNQPGLRARRWPQLFPWVRKHVALLAEAASFQCGAGTRGNVEEAA